jgi:N-acetylglucosamine-6-phosphate deacetylase
LISDSVAPTGLGDGEFEIWGEKVSVKNGQTQNERGSIAGSVITMIDAARRMRSLGFSEAEVSMMGSRNPAALLDIDSTRGTLDMGKRADIILLDRDGNLIRTVIGGRVAYDAAL